MAKLNQWNTFNVCKVAIESYRASILKANGLSLQGISKVDKNGFPWQFCKSMEYSTFLHISVSEYVDLIMNIILGQGRFTRAQAEAINKKAMLLKEFPEDYNGYFTVIVTLSMSGEALVELALNGPDGNLVENIQSLTLDIEQGTLTMELPSLEEPKELLLNNIDNIINSSTNIKPFQKECLKQIKELSFTWTLFIYGNLCNYLEDLCVRQKYDEDLVSALLKETLENDVFLTADRWIKWKNAVEMRKLNNSPETFSQLVEVVREMMGMIDESFWNTLKQNNLSMIL